MARFARIDSQIRANRVILANRFRVPEPNPLFCESRFGGLKIANRKFEAIRANRSHVMKGFFVRLDSRESIRVNRPDSRCESPGHLRGWVFAHKTYCICCEPNRLGEGSKQDPVSKDLPRVSCTIRNLFCTSATPDCSSAGPAGQCNPRLFQCRRRFAPLAQDTFFFQKTVLGRVRVKFAQNEGHEKATKKPRKGHEKRPNTVFPSR